MCASERHAGGPEQVAFNVFLVFCGVLSLQLQRKPKMIPSSVLECNILPSSTDTTEMVRLEARQVSPSRLLACALRQVPHPQVASSSVETIIPTSQAVGRIDVNTDGHARGSRWAFKNITAFPLHPFKSSAEVTGLSWPLLSSVVADHSLSRYFLSDYSVSARCWRMRDAAVNTADRGPAPVELTIL